MDGVGRLFIADEDNHRIRLVDQAGIITTVAGSGATGIIDRGFGGDGGPATRARLNYPEGLFIDPDGNLFIADKFNHRIRKVDSQGIITTVAGSDEKGFSGDGGPAVEASLYRPSDVFVADDRLYIADKLNHRVRVVDTSGTITTLAGTGPSGMNRDPNLGQGSSSLYVADNLFAQCRGIFGTIACLNAGAATSFLTVVRNFISNSRSVDYFTRIRSFDLDDRGVFKNNIMTPFKSGLDPSRFGGDGGPATEALLHAPERVFVDAAGIVFVADWHNYRVRRIDLQGVISTVAGTGLLPVGTEFLISRSGDFDKRLPANQAPLGPPNAIFVDQKGDLLVSDWFHNQLYRIGGVATPTTLEIGAPALGAPVADLEPPLLLASEPPADAQGLESSDLKQNGIRFFFNEPLDRTQIEVSLYSGTDTLNCAYHLEAGDSVLVVPLGDKGGLIRGGDYRLEMNGVADRTGNRAPVAVLAFTTAGLPGDFNRDGQVDFIDFFLLTVQFQLAERDDAWDRSFDLDGDGDLQFADFFVFVGLFQGESRGKLMRLAQEHLGLPATAELGRNYPNPFNAETTLPYQLPESGYTRLDIFNLAGQKIRVLVDETLAAGRYLAVWRGLDDNGRPVGSGTYLVRFQVGNTMQVSKLLLAK
jgi:hypothetical protein